MGTVAKSKENLKKCTCIGCPSYTLGCKLRAMPKMMMGMIMRKDISKMDHFEGLFCAYEASNCIKKEKGCVCATCPVYKENNLDKLYYCIK